MQNLFVVHKKKCGEEQFSPPRCELDWSTCVRSIGFCRTGLLAQKTGCEVFRDDKAYEFLLQIVCGLHSPVFAETEVMGQFRDFVMNVESKFPELYPYYQNLFLQLLTDAKKVRTQHLRSLGSQTYGSMIRRLIGEKRDIKVLGAGRLAQEILPWLEKQNSVAVKCRRPEKLLAEASQLDRCVQVEAWSQKVAGPADVVIVAAPIDNNELLSVCPEANTLIDLREAKQSKGLSYAAETAYNLKMFFELFDMQSHQIDLARQKALAAVKHCSLIFRDKSTIRPFGWEDLCG